jgi:hypothetical protein
MNTIQHAANLTKAISDYTELCYIYKVAFHKIAKAFLKSLAKDVPNLEDSQFEVRHNYGGNGVRCESILHTDHWYIMVQPNIADGKILYRRCNGRKDYCGETNMYATPLQLIDVMGR